MLNLVSKTVIKLYSIFPCYAVQIETRLAQCKPEVSRHLLVASPQVSAHAMNNMGPTAQIISRDGWNTGMDFVGHRKAVTCVVSLSGAPQGSYLCGKSEGHV